MSWVSGILGKLTGGAIGDAQTPSYPPGIQPYSPTSGYSGYKPGATPGTPGQFASTVGPDGQTYTTKDGGISWTDVLGKAVDIGTSIGKFLHDNAGSILQAGGAALGALESEKQTQEKLAEQKAEFGVTSAQQAARDAAQQAQFGTTSGQQAARDAEAKAQFGRTTGDTEAQAAVRAQTQLNQSPIADKAQALILARMGVSPGVFQPRDITRGVSDLSRPSVAPGANVAATLQKAAAGYKPGQGGVDTSVLRSLIAKLTGSSGLQTQPTQPTGGEVFPSNGHPVDQGPTPPDIFKTPITPRLPPLKPTTTGPTVIGQQPLPPKIPFNNPVQPPTPTQPVIPTIPDDAGSGSDQEPDPSDPTEILKRKMQLAY